MRSSTLLLTCFIVGCGSGDATESDAGEPVDASAIDAHADHISITSDAAKDVVVDSAPSVDAATCGTCPQRYACGTANGLPVCRSTTTDIPLFSNIYVIVMENTSLSTLASAMKQNQAPNLSKWQSAYATASDYHGVAHPSLPNYLALTSGDTQGVGCDCGASPGNGSCFPVLHVCLSCSCDVTSTVKNLGDQLEAANISWMDFGEDMGTPCNLTDNGKYAVRHNPFLYYDNIQKSSSRCNAHVVDFKNFDPSKPLELESVRGGHSPQLRATRHRACSLPRVRARRKRREHLRAVNLIFDDEDATTNGHRHHWKTSFTSDEPRHVRRMTACVWTQALQTILRTLYNREVKRRVCVGHRLSPYERARASHGQAPRDLA